MYSARRERGGRRPGAQGLRAARRVVIATKVYNPMSDDPNDRGLSRKHILRGDRRQPAAARHRLRRSLPDPPLRPAHADRGDARGAGRRRPSRQGALHRRVVDVRLAVHEGAGACQRQHGWAPFVSMQNHYNLIYREEEREMLPLCRAEGIGVIPWSPLARGRLRAGNRAVMPGGRPSGPRPTDYAGVLYDATKAQDDAIIDSRPARWRNAWPFDGADRLCLGLQPPGHHGADRRHLPRGATGRCGGRPRCETLGRGRNENGSALPDKAGCRTHLIRAYLQGGRPSEAAARLSSASRFCATRRPA